MTILDVRHDRLFPVILCGGKGTRLWPLSRSMFPKQFIKGLDGSSDSLLGQTLMRLTPARGFEPPIILTNSDYRFLVEEEISEAGLSGARIVLEPSSRNTAPAIAVAAILAAATGLDAVIVVMPSDHAIRGDQAFAEAVRSASTLARTQRHVLFGVHPTEPHTGYGYIRRGEAHVGVAGAFRVSEFLEKPSADKARSYLESGDYLWNSGIFVLHAATLIDDLKRHQPDAVHAAEAALVEASTDLGFTRLGAPEYSQAPSISIDYALFERTSLASIMPLDLDWSDIGSFASLHDFAAHDDSGNSATPNTILEGAENTFVRSTRNVVAALGTKDLIIVDTPDALLVADRSRSQDVGKIVARLKTEGRKEHEQHVRNYRPWGYFETLALGPRFQVKRLHVKPGAKLSMQMHHHRSEHWIVVNGTAKVTIGEIDKLVRENESVYIFATQWHRLENSGMVPVELIEVQIGTYFGEDDIIRGDDIYNRLPEETK